MGFPSIICEIAFTTDPGAFPAWANVSAYVRGFTINRGHQHELDRMEAGTATVKLDNRDRRFDPLFAAGPYYPNVLPVRRLRLTATWGLGIYRQFSGFIESWPQEWPQMLDAEVEVEVTDGFKMLALASISPNIIEGLSGSHITAALDAAGWPAANRIIGVGKSTMQAVVLDEESALTYCLEIARGENGWFYMDPNGSAVFRDRHYRILNKNVSAGIFGDAAGELPYADLYPSYDESEIWNRVVATRIGGADQTWEDAASEVRYFTRARLESSLRLSTDPQALSLAQALVGQYKEPALRVRSITLHPQGDDLLWPHVLGRVLGDRITVRRRPPGGGAMIEEDVHIEAISHVVGPKWWETKWMLSPADNQAYWVLDDPVLSVLDSTTRLAF